MYVCMYVFYVCVCEYERESEREGEKEKESCDMAPLMINEKLHKVLFSQQYIYVFFSKRILSYKN